MRLRFWLAVLDVLGRVPAPWWLWLWAVRKASDATDYAR